MVPRRAILGVALSIFLVPAVRAAERTPDLRTAAEPAQSSTGISPEMAGSEAGCLGQRMQDYLERHGDDGWIDPVVRLELARDFQRVMQRERGSIRPNAIGGTVWTSIGPTNGAGRMTAVAPHPSVPGTVIAGAAGGGAWKTTDTGATWTALTDSIPNLSVGAVAYAPSDPTRVYLGTGEGGAGFGFIPGIGLLHSSDGGANWTLPTSVVASMIYKISVHPTNPNELVIATDIGALRSTAGQNGPWTTVIPASAAAPGTAYGHVTDLVRDPTNALVLYATTWDRFAWCAAFSCFSPNAFVSPTVLKSTDGGQTWNPASTGLPVSTESQMVNRMAIAISPSSPQTLYVATTVYDETAGTEIGRIYRTINGGGSWTETALSSSSVNGYLGGQSWYDNTIVVSPANPDVVFAGGVTYVRTTNPASSWVSAANTVHVDAHDLRYDAGGTLFIANDGGIWTSTDHGVTTTARNTGLVTRQFYALANDPANRSRVFGGQQDNGTIRRSDAGGTTWDVFGHSDGFQCAVVATAPSIALATTQNGNVLRSANAGAAFPTTSAVPPVYGELAPFFSLLTPDPNSPPTLFAATHRVWKTSSAGDAWTPLPKTTTDGSIWATNSNVRAIAVAKSNSQIIMAAKANKIFRSTNGGASWVSASTGLPGKNVNGVEIDPNDPNTAYAALAGVSGTSVYRTIDGGGSWSPRGTGLPSFSAQVVRVDPTDSNALYCGTDVGVYRSTDGGANWSRFGTGMPAVSVYDVQALRDGAILRAATHGRGMWELTVTGTTNNAPSATITTPAAPTTIARGDSVTFNGTTADVDGQPLTSLWTFPDNWTSSAASNGVGVTRTFPRAGIFPVALSATDPDGAMGAASVEIKVPESGDDCANPVVIPSAGPFPYTLTFDMNVATRVAADPNASSCQGFTPQKSIWLRFTPATTGTYQFSLCGSRTAAVVVGYNDVCAAPYTENGVCLSRTAGANCASEVMDSVTLTAGTPVRFLLANRFYNESGSVSLTVIQSSANVPVVNSVTPAFGSTGGGTPVVITGSGFVAGATVELGGVAATSVSVLTSNIITAITGAHGAGDVDVKVTNPSAGTGTLGLGFTYVTIADAPAAPANVVATGVSASQVNVSWTAVAGADHYEVYRKSAGVFELAGSPATNSLSDGGRPGNTAFLYKVKAVGAGGTSLDSNVDIATTRIYTDDPIIAGVTAIKAVHVTELRAAVDAVRTLAGLGGFSFTDASLETGAPVKSAHVIDLRAALDAARAALSLPALTYTNTIAAGASVVSAIDTTEIRNGTK